MPPTSGSHPPLKFGYYTPNFDFCGDVRVLAGLAADAEAAGWDGFYLWDHLQFTEPVVDPWIALTAMALQTERIRLGTLVTPVPRRHLGKLAREIITLDHLSGGRLTLGVGAGYPYLPDYAAFGDGDDPRTRATALDEGLDVLSTLLSGQPVNHHGDHYDIECAAFTPTVQQPRVPIWVAASWPARNPLRRAARWDGLVTAGTYGLDVAPDDVRSAVDYVTTLRTTGEPFDVIRFGTTESPSDTAVVDACREAGATWWIESSFTAGGDLDATRKRIQQGPPRG